MFECFTYNYMCAHMSEWWPQESEEYTGSLKLKLQMVLSHHMGPGNHTAPSVRTGNVFVCGAILQEIKPYHVQFVCLFCFIKTVSLFDSLCL